MDAEQQERPPMNVRCTNCKHVWVAMYFPLPISAAAKLLKHLHCPMCAAPSIDIKVEKSP